MPAAVQPGLANVHANRPLTSISVAYFQDPTNFAGMSAIPRVPSKNKSDTYYTLDRGMFNRDQVSERAPGATADGVSYDVDNSPEFNCKVYAVKHSIPDQIRANADEPLDLERQAAQLVAHQMLINAEKKFASTLMGTSLWGTDLSPSNKWDVAAGQPISEVRTGQRTILQNTGFLANTIICGRQAYDTLLDSPEIVDRLNRGQTPVGPAKTNVMQLASLFEVEKFVVANAIENTAAEGATNVHSFIASEDDMLLCYVPPNPGILTPSAAYTFVWTGFAGNSAGFRTKRYRDEPTESWIVEGQSAFVHKLVEPALGYYFNNVTT